MGKFDTITFIKKAKEIHGDLYDYSKVNYVNMKTKVEIIDYEYGSFYQTPVAHIHQKQNHPLRGKLLAAQNKTFTTDIFIEKAKKVHGDLYDYSKVNYIDIKTPVIIIDPEYGEFYQKPLNHLSGKGNINRANINKKLSVNEFIEKANQVHKNGNYDYSKVKYEHSKKRVIIIDLLLNEEFEQTPFSHLQGYGNPNRKIKNTTMTIDHIVPISLILSHKERKQNIHHPLLKYFEDDRNKQLITLSENCSKQDKFILFGTEFIGSYFRNNMDVIRYLFKRVGIEF